MSEPATFTCARCGAVCTVTVSAAEADIASVERWGLLIPREDREPLCDECWDAIAPPAKAPRVQ